MVITGAEEARLIHLAAVYGVDVGSARAVVIDIGGGSVEITLGTGTAIQLARSFKIGVIRLTERFVKTDPLSERDERRLAKHVLDEIDRHCEQIAVDRLRSRHRHVRHHPQPRHRRRDRGARFRAGGASQPAGVGEADSPRPERGLRNATSSSG